MLIPFRKWHFDWLADGERVPGVDVAVIEQLPAKSSFTYVAEGEPIACGGVVPQWNGRGVAWAYLKDCTGPHMLAITRAARAIIDESPGRVEATVREDFAAGHRWMRLLGFEVETPRMRGYGPEGEDHTGYVRFN